VRHLLLSLWLLSACGAVPAEHIEQSLERFHFEHAAMGTSWTLQCYAEDASTAERAARAAFLAVDEVERVATDYDPASELSRLGDRASAGAMVDSVVLSALLFELLVEAQSFARLTDGAFDPTLGASTKLWRRAKRQGEPPTPSRLDAARASGGWRSLELDNEHRAARLGLEGMRLDLGGVAKGQALDRALAALVSHGIERALIEGGGDLRAGAPPPGESHWWIALEGTSSSVPLAHAGMASSGDHYRGFDHDGSRYSHILDPRSGHALSAGESATVIAPTAAEADAFASAACVAEIRVSSAWFTSGTDRSALIRKNVDGVQGAWISPAWPVGQFPSSAPNEP